MTIWHVADDQVVLTYEPEAGKPVGIVTGEWITTKGVGFYIKTVHAFQGNAENTTIFNMLRDMAEEARAQGAEYLVTFVPFHNEPLDMLAHRAGFHWSHDLPTGRCYRRDL